MIVVKILPLNVNVILSRSKDVLILEELVEK